MNYPISKYKGQHPDGEWEFIKFVETNYIDDAYKEAARLQKEDPECEYRIWDNRDKHEN